MTDHSLPKNTPAAHPAQKSQMPRWLIEIFEWAELFVYSFAIVLLLITTIVRHSPVKGESMTNTLQNADVLIVWQLFYQPKNGDIVVAQSPSYGYNEPLVKRVIATGGQTVDIDSDTWTVYVYDGTVEEYERLSKQDRAAYALKEDYVRFRDGVPMNRGNRSYPIYVPEGYVFLMGDNRNGSTDSRSTSVGLIDARNVIGHVIFRILPIGSFGTP